MTGRWAKAQRLVVVGSVLVDVLVYLDALPARGGDVLARARRVSTGGGFNVLDAAGRQGLPGAYLGRIGDGPFGRQVAHDLARAEIKTLLGLRTDADTGFTIGIVEADAERSFITCPGVEAELDASDLRDVVLSPFDVVYVSGYDLAYPDVGPALTAFLCGLPQDHLIAIDPGPVAAASGAVALDAVLGCADLFSASISEAHNLTGCPEPADSVVALARRLPLGGLAVVRAGADGCWLALNDGVHGTHVAAYEAAAIDTTGAGDVHVGTMLARLAKGDRPEEAARIANLAAALAIEQPGGATAPTSVELIAARASRQSLDRPRGTHRHNQEYGDVRTSPK